MQSLLRAWKECPSSTTCHCRRPLHLLELFKSFPRIFKQHLSYIPVLKFSRPLHRRRFRTEWGRAHDSPFFPAKENLECNMCSNAQHPSHTARHFLASLICTFRNSHSEHSVSSFDCQVMTVVHHTKTQNVLGGILHLRSSIIHKFNTHRLF